MLVLEKPLDVWFHLKAYESLKVASKKAEVDELLKALNVNAANPIVCLTQVCICFMSSSGQTAKLKSSKSSALSVESLYTSIEKPLCLHFVLQAMQNRSSPAKGEECASLEP